MAGAITLLLFPSISFAETTHQSSISELPQCQPDTFNQSTTTEIAVLDGHFIGFSNDGQHLNTRSSGSRRTRLYDLSGNEIDPDSPQPNTTTSFSTPGDVPFFTSDTVSFLLGDDFDSFSVSVNIGHYRVVASLLQDETYIYDLNDDDVVTVEGFIQLSHLNTESLLTSSLRSERTWLYDFSGNLLASLQGAAYTPSRNAPYIVTSVSEKNLTYLYDATGNELAVVEGAFLQFSPRSQRIATSPGDNDRAALYDVSGHKLTSIKGSFPEFSEDGTLLLTKDFEDRVVHLYDAVTGNKIATLEGGADFELTPDEKNIVVYSYGTSSVLYDTSGNEIVTFEGALEGFSEDVDRLVTHNLSQNRVYLYELTGTKLMTLEGSFHTSFNDIAAQGKGFLVDSLTDRRTHWYDFSGNEIASFLGSRFRFSDDGQWLVSSNGETCSRLYALELVEAVE
ncbi:MAG: hypothetical protein AAF810_25510 [Cyanobacteria bacterium P01_D01_bin.36]